MLDYRALSNAKGVDAILPIDLDDQPTWPTTVLAFLQQHSAELRQQRTADHDYNLAGSLHRLRNPSPSMAQWDEAKALIEDELQGREYMAFHATRLMDFDDIRREGLLMLDLDGHAERLKRHLAAIGADAELQQVDDAVAGMLREDPMFAERQGQVWMTPLRRFLHDGGCEVFFEGYGGEAIERIAGLAGMSGGTLMARLQTMGTPAVVVARIPVFGWCRRTEYRIAQSMIELYLEQEGDWEAMDHGWDIMIEQDVPADHIIAVVSHDDPSVSER